MARTTPRHMAAALAAITIGTLAAMWAATHGAHTTGITLTWLAVTTVALTSIAHTADLDQTTTFTAAGLLLLGTTTAALWLLGRLAEASLLIAATALVTLSRRPATH